LAIVEAFKYRAFFSYSHRDAAWAKWLHRALESYRIDKDLIGRETPQGPVPKTLRPIFRDREDFSAGHSLNEQTIAALEASKFLIAICSPNAARSPYVNEEIRHFKARGRATRVIPLIVDGVPGDPERECFPPAIRYRVGPDGALTDEGEEPIAADARPEGDGKEIARQKVVAGLLGIRLDEIVRRAERARKRQNRWRVVGATGLALLLSASAFGWTGLNSFYEKMRVEEDVNSARDTADLCEGAAGLMNQDQIAETRRITLAVECVETFSQVLEALPDGTAVPLRVTSSFERYLALLREFKNQRKLTAEQAEVLGRAEIVANQFGLS
jgi:hypothetical protein